MQTLDGTAPTTTAAVGKDQGADQGAYVPGHLGPLVSVVLGGKEVVISGDRSTDSGSGAARLTPLAVSGEAADPLGMEGDTHDVPTWDLRQSHVGDLRSSAVPAASPRVAAPRQDATATKKEPTAYVLKFLRGETNNSSITEDLSCYAEPMSVRGFRNKILLKQLTKKDLVKCKVTKDHQKALLKEVKRMKIESKDAAKATAAKIASLSPPGAASAEADAVLSAADSNALAHFQLVRGWLATLSERVGEDMAQYTDAFYEYGIDMMSSIPLIEQSDLRDIGMPRHHAEIFYAAAEEEKRRQIAEGDRWDPTLSFQAALNKLNYREPPSIALVASASMREKIAPGPEDCEQRRRCYKIHHFLYKIRHI